MRNLKTGMVRTDDRGRMWLWWRDVWNLVVETEDEGSFIKISDGTVFAKLYSGLYW